MTTGRARPPQTSARPTPPRPPKGHPVTATVQAAPPALTATELAVLERAANGDTYAVIAKALGYQEKSVSKMALRLARKLGANNITHAVFLACRLGVLDPRRRHGDHAGFVAHVRRGEEPCSSCRAGEREYKASRRAARKSGGGPATGSPNAGILGIATGGQEGSPAGRAP
ncbi:MULTISPECIES: helix-turn-helix transcriptional regulator [unclassified Streptomyces]|uniref:helix-turn-helix domain-containing protein n=1 Tax=unclassified Streptomyces TaxID=2593676 RepID=UPI002278684F|nr:MULTISPECIES: helix-turn-helix transcriptional regulator [unclassified Streptomyces]